MGEGYLIGCNKCATKKDIDNAYTKHSNNSGNIFNISIGVGMQCFCNEQLEEIYKNNDTMTEDINIDKIIHKNINNGFKFTKYLGYNPYYCENCKKLYNHFYLEMKKDNKIYIPEYICKKCSHVLKIIYIEWEKYYNENKIIKINLNGEDKILLCGNCGNDQFIIMGYYNFD